MTTLRLVLKAFEEAPTTIRLDELSRTLGVTAATLDNMIQYWIRKGYIREVLDAPPACNCRTCYAQAQSCPFLMRLPRRYELAVPPTHQTGQ